MRAIRVLILIAGLLLPLLAAGLPQPAASVSPEVTIWKTVNALTADPGDVLTYTIYLNNPGPQAAARLWVNDTLPAGVQYRGSSVATDFTSPPFVNESLAGNTVRWQFMNFPPAGNQSFRVFVEVTPFVTDGQFLRNVASLWYTNVTGVAQPVKGAAATTTVRIPVLSVAKSGSFTAFDTVAYDITVSNSGSTAAAALWVNDTLPAGVAYVSVAPTSEISCAPVGRRVACTPKNAVLPFAPGSKVWTITARIPSPLPPGTALVNTVFVNYTDSDGTYLGEVRATANLTVQTADIQVVAIANTVVAAPGGTITYTVFYSNNGQMPARTVWINDTLPVDAGLPAVTVVSATPSPVLNTTSDVRWLLSNVAPGNHSLSLVVQTLPSLGEGVLLVNSVALNYTNADGLPRAGSTDQAVVTVSLNVPAIGAQLVASPAEAAPGASVTLVLFYNNSRTALAHWVVAEMFLPPGVPLSSADPLYTSTGPGKYIWNMTDVGSGEHRITIAVTLPLSAAAGARLRTTAFVNYTDAQGKPVGGSQTFADVVVAGPSSPPYLLIGIGAVVAVVAVGLLLWYRQSSGETVIDEVFLLHRDGLLIKHYTRRLKPDVDSDILSGMLIAVQNFVNESFIGEAGLKKEGQLDEMKFGEYRIVLTRGKYVIVAAVVSGRHVEKVPAQIRASIDDLEASLGPVLDSWEGDMDKVTGADRFMQDLISGRYRGRMSRPRGNR